MPHLEPSGNVTITINPDTQVSVSTTTLTFTPLNFNSPQTVTVTAVDDAVVEGAHTGAITHSAAGGNYDGVSISNVVATTTDNDNPGVTITQSGGSTDVTEMTPSTATSTDIYDVVLDLQPSGTVTITITTDDEVDVSPTVLTFTTSNWSAPQTVTVTAVDDLVVEAIVAETSTITHVASGGAYGGVSIADVVANVTDNDVPPSVTVTESAGSTDVTEGGATDTYDVVLDTEPSGDVTITITPGAQASVNTTTLTFTIADFSTPQTVTVTAVDDAIVEAGTTENITSVASGGGYDSVGVPDVVVDVTDNDPGSVNITETSASTDVAEASGNDSYDVVLGAEPANTVTVTITPDSQVTVNTGSLIFTTSTWNTPQTVTVTAVNDTVVEGAHTGTITHSSSGSGYDGVSIADVVANITDDDSASVIVTESGGSTGITESGVTDNYTVVLGLEPSGTVTISFNTDSQVSLNAASLIFTPSNWDTALEVVVTAVNDAVVEGAETSTISHSASGGGYDGVSISNVVASITDNDTPSVTITESGGSTDVTEGGVTDSYTAVLDLQPSDTVTITISPDSQVSLSTTTLTFTTTTWNTPQAVTVTAVDDAVVEGDHSGTITHSASGGGYDGASISSVVANVTDNDSAGGEALEQLEYRWFTNADSISPGSALAAQDTPLTDAVEGTPYHLRMSIEDSVVDLDPGEVFKLQYAVTTTGPWTDLGAPASGATWRGYDNPSAADGTTLSTNQLTSATILETYEVSNSTAATPVKIDATKSGEWAWVVQPNDTLANTTYYLRMVRGNGTVLETYTTYPEVTMVARSATVTESTGSTDVTEGGASDSYNVVLDAQPSGTVTFTISPDSQVTVSTTTLIFSTINWDTPQTTTVTALDDSVVEAAHTGTVTHSASGGGYGAASIPNVVANVTDDDPGSVTITESAGSTDVTEGGATDTYDVVLDAEPSGTVTITVSPDADASVNPTSLTFTTSNFGSPQTVTVTAVDDSFVEGFHASTITHSASGGGYDGVSISNVVANVTDDEAGPSVTITESAGSTDVTEGGATDTYDVVLDPQPSGTVTITISHDSQLNLSTTTLTFTTSNWDTAQTVTVTPVNDVIAEGFHTSTITHSASGGGFDGVSIPDVVANITDNDTAVVTITELGGSTNVTEGGPTDTYDVVLDTEPTGTVTVTIAPDAQVSVNTTTLTFTTSNYGTPQTVTVTAVDDATIEGSHTGTITHSASSGGYDGVSISNVVANVTDNDSAGSEVLEQLEYRWFTNADSISPGSALAAQDTPLTDAVEGTPYHLRMSIEDSVADLNPGEVFKLQYAVTTTGPWSNLGAPASGVTWRGFNNLSEADGTTLSTNQLTSATTLETYEESNNTAATPTKIDVGKSGEWAWVIRGGLVCLNSAARFDKWNRAAVR